MTKLARISSLLLFAAVLTIALWISRFPRSASAQHANMTMASQQQNQPPRSSAHAYEELDAGADRHPRCISTGSALDS